MTDELMDLEKITDFENNFVHCEEEDWPELELLCKTARAAHEWKAKYESLVTLINADKAAYESHVELREENEKLRDLVEAYKFNAKDADKCAKMTEEENEKLREQLREAHSLKEEWKLTKLVTFKEYVHDRLDKAGVPADPEPANNAEHGCRIEGRLNYVFEQLRDLEQKFEIMKQFAEHSGEKERAAKEETARLRSLLEEQITMAGGYKEKWTDATEEVENLREQLCISDRAARNSAAIFNERVEQCSGQCANVIGDAE